MSIGAIVHSVKAVGHLCVGDVGGAAVEGGKAVMSLAVGSVIKEALDGTEVGDFIDSLIS